MIASTGGFQAGNPTELLNALYNDLGIFNDQGNLYCLGEHPSAEIIPPTRGVDWEIMVCGVHSTHTLGMLLMHKF
ncbi:MAG: hypothetical protein R2822_06155 [Spirosomataceae bacterium]